ncbi:MAG: flagellar hook-basal body complex protein FliE [Bacteroidales bacterium]
MEEISINSINSVNIGLENNISIIQKKPLIDFKEFLRKSINELNQELIKADQMVQEMMTGKIDVHQAMIAIEQANLSLRLMIQIRNKIISAYEEIMRMQF